MNVKSPCIDKCQLNDDKTFCKGCFRTPDEISSWNILKGCLTQAFFINKTVLITIHQWHKLRLQQKCL